MIERFLEYLPEIHPEAFVHSRAVLIGGVRVGRGSSIWPCATLRGDDGTITIGENTSIQDGCVIHTTEGLSTCTVGSRVTVGHNAILHGCLVEDDCLIGMGSILLDGVVIERGAFVAAGTLIPPRKRVTAGTMVMGNPMRVVRSCTEEDAKWIDFSWRTYARRAEQYRTRDAGPSS